MRFSARARTMLATTALVGLALGVVGPATAQETVTGTVVEVEHGHDPEQRHGPAEHSHGDAVTYLLDTGTQLYPLKATSGIQSGDTVVATPDGDVLEVTPAVVSAPATTLEPARHNLYVVLAVPAGVTPESSFALTPNSAAVKEAAAYWTAQTGKLTFAVAKTVGSFNATSTCSNYWGLWNEAATKVGFPGGARNHLVLMLPRAAYQTGGCSYGLGTIGGPTSGGRTYSAAPVSDVVAHELGHNMGLGHTGTLSCPTASDATLTSGVPAGCGVSEYSEVFDVMGNLGGRGNLHARNLERLGLLDGVPTVTGTAEARVVTLAPVGDKMAVNRGAKLVDPVSGDIYWVEYRVAAGADAFATQTWHKPAFGVRVLKVNPGATYGTAVLDASPSTNGDHDRVLRMGEALTTTGGSTITLTAVDALGATVRIAGPTAPAPTPPAPVTDSGAAVGLTLPANPVPLGTSGVFTAKVVNRVGSPAVKAVVWVQAENASGGLFGWKWVASGTTTVAGVATVKVPATAVGVRYRAIVPAGPVLGEQVASALSAELPVSQPLSLTASTTRPAVGAPVVFTLKTPGTSAADLGVEVRRDGETAWTAITPPTYVAPVFRTTGTFASAGVWQVRAVRRAAGGFAASATAPVKVTVA